MYLGENRRWVPLCGSEPVMGALENSTSNNHSSVGSSLINVLSVTLELRPKLAMLCLIPVSLLLRQSLKCLNLKFPSHVNMGVLKIANLQISLMKIYCLKLLSVFRES